MELNLAVALAHVARALPERTCLVDHRGARSWAETDDRIARVAAVLREVGLGRSGPVVGCEGWSCGNDRIALLLTNCPEYLELMVGAWRAGATAVNVNYRYVADELRHVLRDSGARAIAFHGRFGPLLAAVRDELPALTVLLQVDDGTELLAGATMLEDALAGADAARAPALEDLLPDDRYVLYTGGTTGLPKGVLWRQADFAVGALGLRRRDGSDLEDLDELVARARRGRLVTLPAPPFMHGAAHWNALAAWCAGGTVVLPEHPDRFDADAVVAAIARHHVTALLVVGDAFAVPLVEALERTPTELPSLRHLLNGGAALTERHRARLLELLPGVTIVDVLGASESGRQAVRDQQAADAGALRPSPSTTVLDEQRTRHLAPGDPELGWLAQRGRIPQGYLGDAAKTEATFPVVDGERLAVPGDRVRWLADGSLELHGRDSVTINTGGEKVFAEEVEAVLRGHPGVRDAIVVGRPSERWGQEVAAVVVADPTLADDELLEHCRNHLARYKAPRSIVRREALVRSPSGKPDYRWARSVVTGSDPGGAPGAH